MLRKAVFIDRDDTIVKDVPYCNRPEDLKIFNGVGDSIKKLNKAGFLVIIITNQSGIGRGFLTKNILEIIHKKLKKILSEKGANIDNIYFCPHKPEDNCNCRKPKPGLIIKAQEVYNIDIKNSYFIGDSDYDIEAANKAGCKSIKINNYSKNSLNFNDAVNIILKKEGRRD